MFGGLFLVFLTIQLAGCSASKGIQPSQVTCSQFLLQMKTHQFSSAYNLLSANCKTLTDVKQTQGYWDLVEKNKGEIQSWSQQGVNFYAGTGGSSVTITYGLQCAKGTSSARFTCVEENGKWLIQGFNFTL